jgi:hypothetical protein
MKASVIKAVIFPLFLNLTLTMWGFEAGHADFLPTAAPSSHVLKTHDCSGKEMHRDLSEGHHCLICHRYSSTESNRNHSIAIVRVFVGFLPLPNPTSLESKDFLTSSPKRGPPVAN